MQSGGGAVGNLFANAMQEVAPNGIGSIQRVVLLVVFWAVFSVAWLLWVPFSEFLPAWIQKVYHSANWKPACHVSAHCQTAMMVWASSFFSLGRFEGNTPAGTFCVAGILIFNFDWFRLGKTHFDWVFKNPEVRKISPPG